MDPQTRTAKIRVEVPNAQGQLRLGMYVTVAFTTRGGERTVVVPRAAVQTLGARQVVFIPDPDEEGSLSHAPSRWGRREETLTTMRSGVEPGEVVVTEGSFFLRAEMLGMRLPVRSAVVTWQGRRMVTQRRNEEQASVVSQVCPGTPEFPWRKIQTETLLSPAMLDFHFISCILETWKQKMSLLLLPPWRTKPGWPCSGCWSKPARRACLSAKSGSAWALAPATLSFHLKELANADLVTMRHEGRFIYCSANFATMNGLLAYLTDNCCGSGHRPACLSVHLMVCQPPRKEPS